MGEEVPEWATMWGAKVKMHGGPVDMPDDMLKDALETCSRIIDAKEKGPDERRFHRFRQRRNPRLFKNATPTLTHRERTAAQTRTHIPDPLSTTRA